MPHYNKSITAETQSTPVDYLFVGSGASSTLLIMSMERRGLLIGKKVLVMDPDAKTKNDKTYCFWCAPDEMHASELNHLISCKWKYVSVNRNKPESLFPLQYMLIPSLALYNELNRITVEYAIQRRYESVSELKAVKNGVEVHTDNGIWYSKTVFDSRPANYLVPKKNEVHLHQSFMGYVIVTETPVPDTECIDLMDFEIPQQEHTQFMYVLPYDRFKILVELTRFGLEAITPEEAEPLLTQYISERFGKFKILETETGCIPMTTVSRSVDHIPGVITIGGRAGAIKPSTGYAFKNMFRHAEILADSLKKGTKPSSIFVPSRFLFYDRLLLLILGRQPTMGKPIFQSLFQKNKTLNVLRFLDEKTSFYQDLRILFSLPLQPFLKAWRYDTIIRCRNLIAPISLLILSLVLWILHNTATDTFSWAQQILLALGLFFVGIPHGAVDHLIESGNLHSRTRPGFIISYLGAAAGYLLLWLILPTIALLFFLVYSAWHFGQTDIQQWRFPIHRPIKSWGWGMLLLGIILCGHLVETNQILSNMNTLLIPLNDLQGKTAGIVLALVAIFWAFRERSPAMLLSACMLAVCIQLPLITSFGLYFLGQHSLNGWSHLKQGLKTNNTALFMKAIPFTAGAFLLFAVMLYCLEKEWLNAFKGHWITAFFVFISCISFPHVIEMHQFYKKSFN